MPQVATNATLGKFLVPDCPRCGLAMLLRGGARGPFFGCRKFPRCRYTAPAAYDLEDELRQHRIVYQTKLYELNGEIISREVAVVVSRDYVDPDEPPVKQISTKARKRSEGRSGNAHSPQSLPLRQHPGRIPRAVEPETGKRPLHS